MTSSIPMVLAVCSGNIGRSPIMEAKLRDLFLRHGLEERVRVISAGIQGTCGTKRPEKDRLSDYHEGEIMLPLLVERGIDISAHCYKPVTQALVEEAALILIPAEDIRSVRPNALAKQFPGHQEKMMLLSELVGRKENVPDFGGSMDPAVHRCALNLICSFLEQGFSQVCELVGIELPL